VVLGGQLIAPAPAVTGRGAHRRDGPDVAVAPRLRHQPALDGLRGLAVAVVVAFHLGRLRGGFLGVDLFFVLSGFLITSLLLAEQRETGAVALGRFWARRARRLLPALLLLLAGVAVLIGVFTPAGDRPTFRGDALATLGYVANWEALADEADYWDMFTHASPLDHMWSLAIEEQFYLAWPLVVVGALVLARRRGRSGPRLVAAVSLAGAAASFAVLAVTYSPVDTSRAYYGTDARVGPTLLGAALAALCVGRLRSRAADGDDDGTPGAARSRAMGPAGLAGAAGLVALAVMAWSLAALDGVGPGYYRGGLAAFALAAVVLVWAVTGEGAGAIGRVLAVRPLAALGVISYGVYLWHWPVIVYLTPGRGRVDGWALDGLRIAVTLALAVGSYVAVERPIRRGALRGRTVRLALVGSLAVTTVAVVVTTAGVARVPGTDIVQASGEGNAVVLVPASIPEGARRIMLVGDSGAIYLGPALADEAERVGTAAAATDARPWCTVLMPEGVARHPGGDIERRAPCHDQRHGSWGALAADFDPDVVVYYLAAGGAASELLLDGEWRRECEPAYDRYLVDALVADLDVLAAEGATVVLATTPLSPAIGMSPRGLAALGCRTAIFDRVVAARPATGVVDMAAVVHAGLEGGTVMFRDPVHLSDEGAEIVARWLVPAALAASGG